MDKGNINTIEWKAPEYKHKERSMDFFWTIGIVAIVSAIIAIWFGNYVFAIFIIVAGGCLIMFTFKKPENIEFAIDNDGLHIGKDMYPWKNIKSFDVKEGMPFGKLMVETSRKFLPIFTIPLPSDISNQVEDEFEKIAERKEIAESQSMAFAEKIGL